MRPAPDAVAPGPLVIRPRRLRVVAAVMAATLTLAALYGWLVLPRNVRDLFTPSQVLTLLGLLGALLLVMISLALSVVRADETGLRFRNGLRSHVVPWDRVHKIILRRGDPWAMLLLTPADGRPFTADLDADKRQLMALQYGDGAAAQIGVEELRRRQRYYADR
ncbi:PH domain-containing protein [uncultured Friedmanniella sp.]|uniref:PH domain-containing protein n=1 Tax=uncultured Friedmanniella sp. TaxID=335381 RepID=UPI0035CC72D1